MTGATPAERTKYLLKLAAAWCLYLVGALHLWKRVALRGRAVVLVYHRVLTPGDADRAWSHPALVVSPETFERQMRLLARWFKVLTPVEFASFLERNEPFPTGSCLVTFDDGWEDTYREAWPVLRRHAIPALVFLPVHLVGAAEAFWQERLGYLLFSASRRGREDASFADAARERLAPLQLDLPCDGPDRAARASVFDRVQACKRHGTEPAAVIPVLAELLGESGQGPDGNRLVTWDQVREMAREGITFGGHGATHRILTTLPPDAVEEEARAAREAIARELGTPPAAFSYPNGNLDDGVAAAVRRAGFRLAFSMKRALVAPGTNPAAVPRINIHEDVTRSRPMFLARILGLF